MDLTKWKEKASELLNKFIEALRAFPAALGKICANLSGKIDPLADRLLGRFPEEKRRPILFAFGGLVVLLFILIISTVVIHAGRPKKGDAVEMSAGPRIPPEELFIPTEPDFLPEFLLEREQRSSWSLDDIRPYWKSPGNQELWQDEIKTAVDKLMEAVP